MTKCKLSGFNCDVLLSICYENNQNQGKMTFVCENQRNFCYNNNNFNNFLNFGSNISRNSAKQREAPELNQAPLAYVRINAVFRRLSFGRTAK